jgi:putative DNA primase/helicase
VKNKSSPEEKFRDECRKRIRSLNTRKYLSNVMELAKSYLPVTTNEFDRHPLLINLKNGTFNLDLHEFREHEPKDLISKQCPTNFDEMADCPKWKAFLLRIFQADKDLVEFIKQLVGYSFTGLADLDVLLYCHGGGANGKSTFIKTLQELGGDYIENIPVDVLLLKNRNDTDAYQLSRMKGTRMVFTDEIPGGRTLNESLVKSITGGDTINARNPYEKPYYVVLR